MNFAIHLVVLWITLCFERLIVMLCSYHTIELLSCLSTVDFQGGIKAILTLNFIFLWQDVLMISNGTLRLHHWLQHSLLCDNSIKLFLTRSHVRSEAKLCCHDYFSKWERYGLCNMWIWHECLLFFLEELYSGEILSCLHWLETPWPVYQSKAHEKTNS